MFNKILNIFKYYFKNISIQQIGITCISRIKDILNIFQKIFQKVYKIYEKKCV